MSVHAECHHDVVGDESASTYARMHIAAFGLHVLDAFAVGHTD